MKRTIALLTDFGLRDNYLGVMKGVIVKINPSVNLIDISHSITSHNVREGAFLLLKSYKYFPKNTIFLCLVDPGVGSERKVLILKTKNYFLIGPDNGVLTLAAQEEGIEKIINCTNTKFFLESISSTFHGRDIFAPLAAHLSKGVDLNEFGEPLKNKDIKKITLPFPKKIKGKIQAKIIYLDKFGNIITNIKKSDLKNSSKFKATLNKKTIKKIYNCYQEAEDNQPFFIEGSFGYLEISLKNKSAKDFFSLADNYEKYTLRVTLK